MLKLKVQTDLLYDNDKQEFVSTTVDLELEHSLVSLSKWESKFEKPFLGPKEKTTEEILWYIYFMILTPRVPFDIVNKMSSENLADVQRYIDAKMTGTTVRELSNQSKTKEIISSELIYYWLISYQIPWDVEKWHLNRLFTLIKVCNTKNDTKPKKMSQSEMLAQRNSLNAQRKQQMGSRG